MGVSAFVDIIEQNQQGKGCKLELLDLLSLKLEPEFNYS